MEEFQKEFQQEVKVFLDQFENLLKSNSNKNQASPSFVGEIKINIDNRIVKISEIASIINNGARSLRITPFDGKNIQNISNELWKTELGNITSTKNEIFFNFNPLTQEHVKKLQAAMKKEFDNTKIKINSVRQKFLNNLKKNEKSKNIIEINTKLIEKEKESAEKILQKIFDQYMNIKY